jgi:hypothetical protein
MPQNHRHSDNTHGDSGRAESGRAERSRSEKSSPAMQNAASGDVGARNITAGLRLQKEMLGLLSDMGQDWFARATAEAELALRLPNRLTAARSVPDAVTAYQEWLGEWMDRCSEDSQRLLSDGQKMVVAGTRCFTGSSPCRRGDIDGVAGAMA